MEGLINDYNDAVKSATKKFYSRLALTIASTAVSLAGGAPYCASTHTHYSAWLPMLFEKTPTRFFRDDGLIPNMTESSVKSKSSDAALMADSTFDIISQIEKKADFLHTAFEEYVRDAEKDGRPELTKLWNSMKEDEEKHLRLLKEELMREVRDNSL